MTKLVAESMVAWQRRSRFSMANWNTAHATGLSGNRRCDSPLAAASVSSINTQSHRPKGPQAGEGT